MNEYGALITAAAGIVGVLVGGAITLGVELLRLRQASETERSRLAEERRRWADDFQRTNLLEIQEHIIRLARAAAEVSLEDQLTIRSTGKRGRLPEELNTRFMIEGREYNYRVQRVLDDELRASLLRFTESANRVVIPALAQGSPVTALAHYEAWEAYMALALGEANNLIGLRLRALLER